MNKEEIKKINEKTSQNINLIYALAMIQETLIVDVEVMQKSINGYKYNIKNKISKISELAKGLRAEVNNKCDPEFTELLGDKSEEIWELLVKHFGERV